MAKDWFGIDDGYHDARGGTARHLPGNAGGAARRHGRRPAPPPAPGAAAATSADAVRVLAPGRRPGAPGWRAIWCSRTAPTRALDGDARPTTSRSATTGSTRAAGGETLLIVAPGRCFLPDDLRDLGIRRPGLRGALARELGDRRSRRPRRASAASTKRLGGGVVMVNPLTAPTPVPPIEPSPYYPSSRRFRNPLFLRIEEVPGWDAPRRRPARAARERRDARSSAARRIDRDAIFALKLEALEAIFARFDGRGRLRLVLVGAGTGADRLRDLRGARRAARQGLAALARRATAVPTAPTSPAFRAANERARPLPRLDAVADRHASSSARRARSRVIHDLPIGLDVAGADAWCWQDLMARDVSVGAPRRRVQRQRPGLGPHPVHPVPPARRPLPPVHRDHPRDAAARGRPAHRPRDGSVPAVLDPARARREGRGPTCARAPTSCWRSSRSRASAPGPSSSARIWARSSRASASGSPPRACCRTGCSTSSRRRPRSFPSSRCRA